MSASEFRPFRVEPGRGVVALDQTLLPGEERYLRLETVEAMCEAIRALRVRGAPMLGLAGVSGMAIAAETSDAGDESLAAAARALLATRPTAADLGAGVARALAAARELSGAGSRRARLWEMATSAVAEQLTIDERIGEWGAPLLAGAGAVLTHCNTGALATGGTGTALAVIARAHREGMVERCYATETRPLLQGARLTMWELAKLGVPGTLLPDSAAAALIASGRVGAVVAGADRVAANGDVANKIGTYGLALAAREHGVPFYIAAPRSTFDGGCPGGSAITIEFRPEEEVGGYGGQRWAPDGVDAYNPAFDVTPARLITAIVTEDGVLGPPWPEAIATFLR